MQIMNINLSVKYDEDWDDKFKFMYYSSSESFTTAEKLQLAEAIRKGFIEEEIEKMTEILESLKQTNLSDQNIELDKIINIQSKILKELQDAKN